MWLRLDESRHVILALEIPWDASGSRCSDRRGYSSRVFAGAEYSKTIVIRAGGVFDKTVVDRYREQGTRYVETQTLKGTLTDAKVTGTIAGKVERTKPNGKESCNAPSAPSTGPPSIECATGFEAIRIENTGHDGPSPVRLPLALRGRPRESRLACRSGDGRPAERRLRAGPNGAADTTVRGNINGASRQRGEPRHADSLARRSVWYRFRAKRKVTLGLSTCRTTFDTVIAVYGGRSLRTLRGVDFNNDGCGRDGGGSRAHHYSPARTHVPDRRRGGRSSGRFRLKVAPIPVPANDDFADAARLRLDSLSRRPPSTPRAKPASRVTTSWARTPSGFV